jgi:N6-L-threonylcarbamoyladenine synthase
MTSACILGIETSCDETAAAVVSMEGTVLSNVLRSQHDIHERYGGVVPELASRQHVEVIEVVVQEAMDQAQVSWDDVKAVAVTYGPGLAGALVVGVSFGKALAYAANIPVIGVHHLQGHIASAWIDNQEFPFPCVVLVVSGGHTHLYLLPDADHCQLLGRTIDDAAGEAFDKGAKMLGLGFPGGPALDRLAAQGNREAVHFPRPYLNRGGLNFSFSGIKTSLLYHLRDRKRLGIPFSESDIAAGYQEAIVDVLVAKAFRAVGQNQIRALAVVGGVSANSRLRHVLKERSVAEGIQLAMPSREYCTDNAAMIASAGLQEYKKGRVASWDLEASASMSSLPLSEIRAVNSSLSVS